MDSKLKNQIDRITMLSEMVTEKLSHLKKDCQDYLKWKEQNPEKYWCDIKSRTNRTEVKRVMLVLRQEMIKLEKML